MDGTLGLKMSDKEGNEYLESLFKGKRLEGVESQFQEEFLKLTADIQTLQKKIQELRASLEMTTTELVRIGGKREAFITLLINAEEGRRNAHTIVKMPRV